MPKDTKSLDNNKAPACESRGFVHKKKEGVHFDTPSSLFRSSILLFENPLSQIIQIGSPSTPAVALLLIFLIFEIES